LKVYNVNIKNLIKALVEIYESSQYVDIEISDNKIRLTPIKITKLIEDRKISQDTDLETLI